MVLVSNIEIGDSGRWFMYHTNPEDEKDTFDLCIGSTALPGYKKLQRSIARRFVNDRKGGFDNEPQIPDSQVDGVMVEYALELLQNWRGFELSRGDLYKLMGTPDEGVEIEVLDEVITIDYTKEVAKAMFTNPGFAPMLDFVIEMGGKLSAHTKKHTEGAVKNSQKSSDSKSTGDKILPT